jgi:hypothetical protein
MKNIKEHFWNMCSLLEHFSTLCLAIAVARAGEVPSVNGARFSCGHGRIKIKIVNTVGEKLGLGQ